MLAALLVHDIIQDLQQPQASIEVITYSLAILLYVNTQGEAVDKHFIMRVRAWSASAGKAHWSDRLFPYGFALHRYPG